MEDVAVEFVKQYYNCLTRAPQSLHRFYYAGAVISRAYHGFSKTTTLSSSENALPHPLGWSRQGRFVRVLSLLFQTTGDSMMLFQILGELVCFDGSKQTFMQTVVLAKKIDDHFFVTNDMLVFLDDVATNATPETNGSPNTVFSQLQDHRASSELMLQTPVLSTMPTVAMASMKPIKEESGVRAAVLEKPATGETKAATLFTDTPVVAATSPVPVSQPVVPDVTHDHTPVPSLPPGHLVTKSRDVPTVAVDQPTEPVPKEVPANIMGPAVESPVADVAGTTETKLAAVPVPLHHGAKVASSAMDTPKPSLPAQPKTWASMLKKQSNEPISIEAVSSRPAKSDASKQQQRPSQEKPEAVTVQQGSSKVSVGSRPSGKSDHSAVVAPAGPPATKPDTNQLFLGGLPPGTKAVDIRTFFEKYGAIEEIRMKMNFCFLVFEKEESALAAFKEAQLQRPVVLGRSINVQQKRPFEPSARNGPSPSQRRGGPRAERRSTQSQPGFGEPPTHYPPASRANVQAQ